ncbi:MAG: ribosome small subunit-dependent GTPase A [Saccharofermentans sp.]|nr:ribosome small subunit-dependent GTPase A [Saccharofermentans sp.]
MTETSVGIITKGVGGTYTVRVSRDDIRLCQIRGGIRHKKMVPAVGDIVDIAPSGDPDIPYVLEKIHPRKNSLVRPAIANIDVLVLVFAVKDPEPDLKLLDKMLIICSTMDIRPLIVFSKSDTDGKEANKLKTIYSEAGYSCFISSLDEPVSKEDILQFAGDGLIGLAGPSGVGKSTLCNSLLGGSIMETGDISDRLKRGKHTTRHVQLFEFGDGFITDTPGFTSLDLFELGVDYKSVVGGYPEVMRHSVECRFDDCRHIAERDCKVREEIGSTIDEGRYGRYKEFYEFLYSQRNNYSGGVRR